MLMSRLGPFYTKYLLLLILGVAPFASAQDIRCAGVIVSVDAPAWKTVRAPARLV
jgi:hypothetical protein